MESAPLGLAILYLATIVVTFGILNIVLAVMIEHIREVMEANKHKTAQKLQAAKERVMFSMLDDFQRCRLDEGGALAYSEFKKLAKTQEFSYKLRLCGIHFTEARELFRLIDMDGSGSVTPDEFIAAMHKMSGEASGQDLVHVLCFAEKQAQRAKQYVETVRRLSARADELQQRLNGIGTGLTKEALSRQTANKRNEARKEALVVRVQALKRMDSEQQTYFPQAVVDDSSDSLRPPPPPPLPHVLSGASLAESNISSLDIGSP